MKRDNSQAQHGTYGYPCPSGAHGSIYFPQARVAQAAVHKLHLLHANAGPEGTGEPAVTQAHPSAHCPHPTPPSLGKYLPNMVSFVCPVLQAAIMEMPPCPSSVPLLPSEPPVLFTPQVCKEINTISNIMADFVQTRAGESISGETYSRLSFVICAVEWLWVQEQKPRKTRGEGNSCPSSNCNSNSTICWSYQLHSLTDLTVNSWHCLAPRTLVTDEQTASGGAEFEPELHNDLQPLL